MYVHHPNDSFWLNFYTPPIYLKETKIEPQLYPDLRILDFGMIEVEMDSFRSESNPCNTDENYYLEECVKKAITYLASNLTCATPGKEYDDK